MKKVEKTTRTFRHDLNQILYDYTVEVTNRAKGSELVDTVTGELWTEVPNTAQQVMIKTTSKEKKLQEDRMVI